MTTNDLRLELRTKNNLLWHVIFDSYPSVAAFCRAMGACQSGIGELLNLSTNPWHDDELKPLAQRVCEFTGCGAEELFPRELYAIALPRTAVAEVPSRRFLGLAAAKRVALPPAQDDALDADARRRAVDAALSKLTPRQEQVIRARFGLDGEPATLEEVGQTFGVGSERIRQIEAKAIRRLRHPSRSKPLAGFLELREPSYYVDGTRKIDDEHDQ